jgi:hypothetical protein
MAELRYHKIETFNKCIVYQMIVIMIEQFRQEYFTENISYILYPDFDDFIYEYFHRLLNCSPETKRVLEYSDLLHTVRNVHHQTHGTVKPSFYHTPHNEVLLGFYWILL